jgi:hypothetical protein
MQSTACELRRLTDAEALVAAEELLELVWLLPPPTGLSGLVEQQRLFARARPMNPLFAAAAAVQDLCRERDWGFWFIGGLAVLRWGEPRLTRDIDLTVLVPSRTRWITGGRRRGPPGRP